MELLYPSEANKNLLLYTTGTGLYARTLQKEHIGRPTLLCSNYESGLSSVLYHDTVYYSYINKEHSLLIRALTKPAVLFRLDCTSGVSYLLPQLIVFNEVLLLFYFEKTQNFYVLKSHTPFTDTQPESFSSVFSDTFSELPSLTLQATASHLFVLLTTSQDLKLCRYNSTLSSEPLYSDAEFHSLLVKKTQELQTVAQQLEERNQELQTLRQQLSQKTQELEISNLVLTARNQELEQTKLLFTAGKQEAKELILRLSDSEKALQHTTLLLERAKTQYTELMQVAEKYKEEAMKWYSKFTDRY